MEPTFGRWAWLVNGLCWAVIFHAFMRWNLLAILPSSLLIPYLCQRTGSIWPGVFLHGIGNLLVFGLLLPTLLVS
jgi:membrane protease YdiL (CAAX protease family)